MELLLIRHGLPERSHDTADPPLSPEGHDQARRVARWLAGERIDAVVSSPMVRAVETARPFATSAGHELKLHPGVVEFDRDSGSYVPLEVLKREDYEAWKAFVAGGAAPDITDFQAMVTAAIEEIIAAHPGRRVAVFCHGGVINVWTAHILGMTPRLFFEPGYASVHRYLCARSGERNVVALNERAHLRDDWPALASA
ncbi:MAG TPA: histidine phosphatase family protein [Phenylobacterium sp.]|jgi:probable phosphoglycerate mutase|nr:histidine phosphatase family protein [Phenylobacterium sp.]